MDDCNRCNKLPRKYDNPIDVMFQDTSYFMGPSFLSNKFTPNMITTLSFIFGVIVIYCMEINKFKIAAVFHLLSYLFDCFDGNFARRYNMETEFGDWYDHLKDTAYSIAIIYMLYRKMPFKANTRLWIFLVILGLFSMSMIFFGCTELYIKKNRKYIHSSTCLGVMERICLVNDERFFRIIRYFSSGTLVVFIFGVIWSISYY